MSWWMWLLLSAVVAWLWGAQLLAWLNSALNGTKPAGGNTITTSRAIVPSTVKALQLSRQEENAP